MAHKNYRRKNKQNHHGSARWYNKPTKFDRFLHRHKIRQRDRRLIHHEKYDVIFGDRKLFDTWWW